jgi:hypothetical protein
VRKATENSESEAVWILHEARSVIQAKVPISWVVSMGLRERGHHFLETVLPGSRHSLCFHDLAHEEQIREQSAEVD